MSCHVDWCWVSQTNEEYNGELSSLDGECDQTTRCDLVQNGMYFFGTWFEVFCFWIRSRVIYPPVFAWVRVSFHSSGPIRSPTSWNPSQEGHRHCRTFQAAAGSSFSFSFAWKLIAETWNCFEESFTTVSSKSSFFFLMFLLNTGELVVVLTYWWNSWTVCVCVCGSARVMRVCKQPLSSYVLAYVTQVWVRPSYQLALNWGVGGRGGGGVTVLSTDPVRSRAQLPVIRSHHIKTKPVRKTN